MSLPTIDLDYLASTLKTLLQIPSPTGYTDEIARHVCEELERIGVEYDLTRRGACALAGQEQQARPGHCVAH